MRKLILVLASLLLVPLCVSGALGAQSDYIGGQVGLNIASDASNDYDKLDLSIDAEFTPGVALGVLFGHSYGNGFRFEGELGYRINEVNDFTQTGTSFGAKGEVSALSLLFNSYFDFHNRTLYTPYLGAGIGIVHLVYDANLRTGGIAFDDSATVFAYQLGTGVSYNLNELLALDFGYRFLGTDKPEFEDKDGDTFESEYLSHTLLVGLRYSF